ncbi:protein of unknown function [Candidatus Methylacidiphilum fumarolicum]|uniref:Uncharacterized protein n=1 Tax=Candidatus Methylacidiphilum fumarolicum TaxID=591154 RepID=A0ABM9IGA5_9BACT|nr:protein of unknown function [Candidatus Methylacidiphilum fumarolicum]
MRMRSVLPSGRELGTRASRLGLGEMGEGARLRLSGAEGRCIRKGMDGNRSMRGAGSSGRMEPRCGLEVREPSILR